MKTKIIISFAFAFLVGNVTFAACCNNPSSIATKAACSKCTTVATNTCSSNYCCSPGSNCNCADNGWKYNDCISKAEYCEAFGNIGKLD